MVETKPWPTVADVAAHLRTPLAQFTPDEVVQLQAMLDAATADAQIVPEWRDAPKVPPRVWTAVVALAALEFWIANPGHRTTDSGMDLTNPGSRRYALRLDMGWHRGGRARVG